MTFAFESPFPSAAELTVDVFEEKIVEGRYGA